ncbi:hypothetical protein D9M71_616270 [compost metagenome]
MQQVLAEQLLQVLLAYGGRQEPRGTARFAVHQTEKVAEADQGRVLTPDQLGLGRQAHHLALMVAHHMIG